MLRELHRKKNFVREQCFYIEIQNEVSICTMKFIAYVNSDAVVFVARGAGFVQTKNFFNFLYVQSIGD